MSKIYLFDWGDTLMVDFPEQAGKMCDWSIVQTIDGALETLKTLSKEHLVYIATNAEDSSEHDIQEAFSRVGLSPYIDGYFCKTNLGIGKGSPEFFYKIMSHIGVDPGSIIMVGDNYEHDIEPAITAGIQAIWLNPTAIDDGKYKNTKQISHLMDLCI